MPFPELDRLADRGLLAREPPVAAQIGALLAAGEEQLRDAAARGRLAARSRFQLAYGAAFSLASAGLRRAGFRSDNRYLVFQALEHTLSIPSSTWRVLAHAHQRRNQMEYEGVGVPDERLVRDTITAAQTVLSALQAALRET